jgi:hypothetical protein
MKCICMVLIWVFSVAAMQQRKVTLTVIADGEMNGNFVSSKLFLGSHIKALFFDEPADIFVTNPVQFFLELAWFSKQGNHVCELWSIETRDSHAVCQEGYGLPIQSLLEASCYRIKQYKKLYGCPYGRSLLAGMSLSPLVKKAYFFRRKEKVKQRFHVAETAAHPMCISMSHNKDVPTEFSACIPAADNEIVPTCSKSPLSLQGLEKRMKLECVITYPQKINPFK